MEQRRAKGCMCSGAVAAGTLPHKVPSWEVIIEKEWNRHEGARFFLSQSVALAWQHSTISAFQAPVMRVSDANDVFVDGLYDFVPVESIAGQAPAFQHQQRPNLWLFFASDQRWWIGQEKAKRSQDAMGIAHSEAIAPGTHPANAGIWQMRSATSWEECQTMQVQAEPGVMRARDKWTKASLEVTPVQIWGTTCCHGVCKISSAADGEPPTYQLADDADLWLYMAMDGCWWVSSTECKDGVKACGYLRSAVVEPGTLPQHVDQWMEFQNGSWQPRSMVRILLPDMAGLGWMTAQEAAKQHPVIEIAGVTGSKFNGLYDVQAPNPVERGAPTYQHQVNRDLFLYLADDGRWWVGNANAMQQRRGGTRMCSDRVRPGFLPTETSLGWYIFDDTVKDWELHESVKVS